MQWQNNTYEFEPGDPKEGCRSSLLLGLMIVVFLAVLIITANGCKTCQPIIETRDSIRVEFRHDSVYIYQHDSIFRDRWRSGDTVFVALEKWQTRYKDKIVQVHDTIRTNETQTIEVKHVPAYYKNTSAGFWVLLALLIVWLAFKAYKLYIKIKTGGLIK